MSFFSAITICVALHAVPPLSDDQRVQLTTAGDFSPRFDEAALYPLLQNASLWQLGDETGAMIPDYPDLLTNPGDHRGRLFLIEGLFAGVPEGESLKIGPLTRPGPWDDKLKWWGIVVDQDRDDVVIVYLLDPPAPPRAGAKVRLVARFYKPWNDFDRQQPPQPTSYLTFVGQSVTILAGSTDASGPNPATPLIGAVVVLAVGLFVMRRALKPKLRVPHGRQSNPNPTDQQPNEHTLDMQDPHLPLPDDPAQALNLLIDQHE